MQLLVHDNDPFDTLLTSYILSSILKRRVKYENINSIRLRVYRFSLSFRMLLPKSIVDIFLYQEAHKTKYMRNIVGLSSILNLVKIICKIRGRLSCIHTGEAYHLTKVKRLFRMLP